MTDFIILEGYEQVSGPDDEDMLSEMREMENELRITCSVHNICDGYPLIKYSGTSEQIEILISHLCGFVKGRQYDELMSRVNVDY